MTTFKYYIEKDLDTFINIDEHGELHEINGRQLKILPDEDHLQHRSKKEYDGILVGDVLYYVKASDYGVPPKPDEVQMYDKRPYIVFNVRAQAGLYEIILSRNVS